MKKVQITSEIFLLDWQLKHQDLTIIEIDDHPIAKGGYGAVYEIKNTLIHQFTPNVKWVLKVVDASDPVCKTGYRNIIELSARIKKWQRITHDGYEGLLLNYQALIGFPQGYFKGEFEGSDVYGYIMPDLRSLGFTLFSDIGENDNLYNEYTETSNEASVSNKRLKAVYNLAMVLNLLYENFEYLHGDIKAQSVWLNLNNNKAALIDYDGGTFRPKFWDRIKKPFTANIMGALQPWLSPEILKEVNEETGKAKMEVSLQSELWSFASGAFQILTGNNPFSFLIEDTYYAWKQYLNSNKWPSLKNDPYLFKVNNDERDNIEELFSLLKNRPALWLLFSSTFNMGFKDKRKRKSYSEWIETLLQEIIGKQPIAKIDFSPKILLEGSACSITWECNDEHLYINGEKQGKSGNITQVYGLVPDIKLVNEFGEWPVKVPVEIIRSPVITNVRLSSSSLPIGDSITLSWEQRHAFRVVLVINNTYVELSGTSVICKPKVSQNIELRFFSKYDLDVVVKSIPVEVIHPVIIENFNTDKAFIVETLPVCLQWKVINADMLNITGMDMHLNNIAEVTFRPKKSGEITLTASNRYFNTQKSVYIEVLPVPKIENLKIPALPNLQFAMPDILSGIPNILNGIAISKAVFHQIFDEHE